MKNLLEFFPSARPKSPTEFCSPCPSCGGTDRFLVWPERGDTGRYHCRQCGIGGDGIDYLRTFEGMTYANACRALEIAPRDKQTFHKATASQVKTTRQGEKPQEAMPPEAWTTAATSFLAECQREFLKSSEAVATICGERFIGERAALEAGLGWNPVDRYELREAWGLPSLQGKTKLLIPRGLIIATKRNGKVIALTIRCADDKPKDRPRYRQVAGSGRVPFIVGQTGTPVILMESALDGILAWQEGEGRVACVSTMGSSKPLDAETRAFIAQSPKVICAPDNDGAGHKAWERWREEFPKAVRIAPVGAKDLTDMHKLATIQHMRGEQRTAPYISEWLRIALEIA